METKKTQGRRKIPMKKIEKTEALQVCFSKRRNGLFKKAGEISTLCGAHVAVIAFSPGGRPFSYGHPSVESVLDGYLNPNSAANHDAGGPTELQRQVVEVRQPIAAAEGGEVWWEEPIEGMGVEELRLRLARLEELKRMVVERADDLWLKKCLVLAGDDVIWE